ncbi:hypothetical protein J7F01_15300 [Streptomyces sp. ISL-22]|uniref:hypothetical protein n=1 Tax=unclassified Streptomyces TaxID=2593676 RepID=UPI001BE7F48E|nr:MULTISPECIES: hypothetical protein [unclassified Streptomyces]MBT2423805.1 hypothetical protein [Streptomyces sp. ISL-24]MBT2433525.1 hypothetical protein [Streptomyces sp. ISL-22]
MKVAAEDWLSGRGLEARFAYARPGVAPIGSVLDIEWAPGGRCLRVHLDAAVDPVWDDEQVEPVLGMSVPVDDDTLVRRWYVHRVRFDSVGTSRQVRIGTQAFARPTEWFGLADCEMTENGLRTPAVERIVRSRRTPPPRQVAFAGAPAAGSSAGGVGQDERVRRLREALRAGSVPAVAALCEEFDASPLPGDDAGDLAAALEDAHAFLDRRREVRGELVQQLWQAVRDRKSVRVRSLLVQVETAVGHDRSRDEDEAIRAAGMFLEEQKRTAGWEHRDAAPPVRGPKFSRIRTSASRGPRAAAVSQPPDAAVAAHRRMRDLLGDLRRLAGRLPEREVNRMIVQLRKSADEAGDHVTGLQREEVESWVATTHALHPAVSGRSPHVSPAQAAQRRVRAALRQLCRLPDRPPTRETRRLIELLEKDLGEAGGEVTPAQRRQAEKWIARLDAQQPRTEREPARAAGTAARASTRDDVGTGRVGKRSAERERLSEEKVAEVAAAVRGALKKAARERSTTSWTRLRHQLGSALPHLQADDQLEVLRQVDADTPADEPLLTALLAATDTSSPALYKRAAEGLGRDVPGNMQAARSQWQTDVLHLHQLYRYK